MLLSLIRSERIIKTTIVPSEIEEIIATFFMFSVSIFSPALSTIFETTKTLQNVYKTQEVESIAKFVISKLTETFECGETKKERKHTKIVIKIIIGTIILFILKINLSPLFIIKYETNKIKIE